MRGGIAVHLSIDTAARSGVIAGSHPLQCGTNRPVDRRDRRRCQYRLTWPVGLAALVDVPERARLRLADLDDVRPRFRLADRDASGFDELRLQRGGRSSWRERP